MSSDSEEPHESIFADQDRPSQDQLFFRNHV